MEYSLATRKGAILPFVTTWMDLEHVMLNEISRKDKYLAHKALCHLTHSPGPSSICSSFPVPSSFPIWIPFISFSSLIAIARTFRTILNNCGKSGHTCLVPDLRGNAFSFSPLRIMFAVSLSHMAFTCRGKFLLCLFFEEF